jgi:hypothetical protein
MRKRILKQFALTTATAGIFVNVSAMQPGLYIGLAAGPATNSASEQQAQIQGPITRPPTTVLVQPKSQQFGSRLLMGYMINQYAGMEGGFNYYSTIRYVTKGDDVQTCSSTNARITAFDFVGKGVIPLQQFNVFGKAGVAATYQSTSAAFYPTTKAVCGNSSYITKFVPTVTVGAGYDLNQNWAADFSINNLLVGSKFGNVTTYNLGISYHFVDLYCGQFLC